MVVLTKRKKWSSDDQARLWAAYRSGDKSVYSELCESYVPLVEIIATKAATKLPKNTEFGDLVSDGFLGLVDAIDKFDPSKGYKFETYASTRIRGMIYDELRKYDWVSRYSRIKFKFLGKAVDDLTVQLQREPTTQEIAEFLAWPIEDVRTAQSAFENSFTLSMDELMPEHEEGISATWNDVIPDDSIGELGELDLYNELQNRLVEKLFQLPKQESAIIYLHYFEGVALTDIGKMFDIGLSRVSQILGESLRKLESELV